jgi:hypothetical protein
MKPSGWGVVLTIFANGPGDKRRGDKRVVDFADGGG